MPQITVKTDSAAEPLLVVTQNNQNTVLNLRPNGAQKRSAKANVSSASPALLTWVFGGDPGTKYEIALEPKAKVVLSRGSNPIKSRISTQRFFGEGSVMFEVKS